MSSLIIDLQYFGNVNWFKKVYNYKNVYFSSYENHKKMSFRNRLLIGGADGPLRLTIPIVDGRNERQLYKEIKLVPGRWATEHFRAIVSCYNRSPWFEHYRDELAELYLQKFDYLFDWNLACHDWIVGRLNLSTKFTLLDNPDTDNETGDERKDNAVNVFTPLSTESRVDEATEHALYRQVFHEKTGFVAGLSILDLLFCEGPGARKWLEPHF